MTHNLLSLLDTSSDETDESPNLMEHSPYVESQTLLDILNVKKDIFTIFSLNCQSLYAKYNELKIYIEEILDSQISFSAICLQETWLGDDCDASLLQLPGYNFISKPKSCSRHGGVAIYLRNELNFSILPTVSNSNTWDGIFLEIYTNKKLILGNIYRPPRENIENYTIFINEIEAILSTFETYENIVICGDFNIDLLKIHEKHMYNTYLEMFLSNSYIPKITLPTRITPHSKTLIDNIFVKLSNNFSTTTSGIVISNISDHLPCFTCLDYLKLEKKNDKFIRKQFYTAENLANFINEISRNCNMNNFNKEHLTNPNTNYDILHNIIKNSINNNIPYKFVKFNKYKHKRTPWITLGIITSIKYRDKLYKSLKETENTSPAYHIHKSNLQNYNKILKQNIRLAKKLYYMNCFNKYKNDIKMTWKTIKGILNKRNQVKEYPEYFTINQKELRDKKAIANEFNGYFINIGVNLARSVTAPVGKSFKDYLTSPVTRSFKFKNTEVSDVIKVIDNLKNKSSCGTDGLSNKLLKLIKNEISNPLTLIINQSFSSGIFPDTLKNAKVIPLFKQNDSTLMQNYRPISLLPSISKVIERIIHNQLTTYFNDLSLFYKSQYGFRTGHSTELAALELINRNLEQMDNNNIPLNIYIDLSKAFDTLDHEILLYKLNYYGLRDNELNLFKSYLTNRKQLVDFDGCKSEYLAISTGVPQGSILGPLLFIIYMNDFNTASSLFHPIIYADDSTLCTSLDTFNSRAEEINTELVKVSNWLCLNKLSLNVTKTKAMTFCSKQKHVVNPKIYIDNTEIDFVEHFNFLGILMDRNLSWNKHIDKISKKISKTIGIMSKMKNFLPSEVLLTIYNTLIIPHLTYGLLCWKSKIHNIYKLQKKAIRIIVKEKYNAHTTPIFKNLHLLKATDVCLLHELKLCYKLENNLLPHYFQNNLAVRQSQFHHHNLRSNSNYELPNIKHEFAKMSVSYIIPATYNNAPLFIRDKMYTHSLSGFSNYVKQYLLTDYNVICEIPNCYVCNN